MKVDGERDLLYIKGAVPGTNGNFVRIVDAVMGPFHPSPAPMPTFTGEMPQKPLVAPVTEGDRGKFKEPDDAF